MWPTLDRILCRHFNSVHNNHCRNQAISFRSDAYFYILICYNRNTCLVVRMNTKIKQRNDLFWHTLALYKVWSPKSCSNKCLIHYYFHTHKILCFYCISGTKMSLVESRKVLPQIDINCTFYSYNILCDITVSNLTFALMISGVEPQ